MLLISESRKTFFPILFFLYIHTTCIFNLFPTYLYCFFFCVCLYKFEFSLRIYYIVKFIQRMVFHGRTHIFYIFFAYAHIFQFSFFVVFHSWMCSRMREVLYGSAVVIRYPLGTSRRRRRRIYHTLVLRVAANTCNINSIYLYRIYGLRAADHAKIMIFFDDIRVFYYQTFLNFLYAPFCIRLGGNGRCTLCIYEQIFHVIFCCSFHGKIITVYSCSFFYYKNVICICIAILKRIYRAYRACMFAKVFHNIVCMLFASHIYLYRMAAAKVASAAHFSIILIESHQLW